MDLKELTVAELLESGANVDVYFHGNGDLQKAYNKLKPFKKLGKLSKGTHHSGTTWLKIRHKKGDSTLEFTSFL